MKFNEFDNLNEFYWERELKQQDMHISAYLSELENFIDLPGESDLVSKSLEEKKLIKNDGTGFSELFVDDKDINEMLFMDYTENKNGIKLFNRIAGLASDFNFLLSKERSGEIIVKGLEVLSLYGNLLSNFVDFIDLEADVLPALKVALTKRIVFLVNGIIGKLKELETLVPENKTKINRYIKDLLFIREIIVDIRYKCRTAK